MSLWLVVPYPDRLALAAYEEGLQISTTLDDEMYVSVFLANLGYVAGHRGDYDEARSSPAPSTAWAIQSSVPS